MTQTVVIRKEVRAAQWSGAGEMPEGVHSCRPEVHWSAGRECVYFTYAEMRSRHWIEVRERELPVPERAEGFSGVMCVSLRDGRQYWRRTYPFNMYSLKSESSVRRDWSPVYCDDSSDESLLRALVDYADLEGWLVDRSLPPRAEYRVIDGSYGRGFKPLYLSPGDWLVHEAGDDGRDVARVLTDAQLQAMRVA